MKIKGLLGIITAPLIHGSLGHLFSNSIPLLLLGSFLFYFYRPVAYKVFFLIYFIHGVWVWVFARENYHIGASGLVYGEAAFLFLSGIIRREPRVLALSMLVVFMYGSMVWGIFPDFFPNTNISWESHLMGMLAGFILAIYFRKEGPQSKKYSWELEEEVEDENNGQIKINYNYKEEKN
ncbi:rhomboid family intramembrane serine protease [Bacteroidota bacterium]